MDIDNTHAEKENNLIQNENDNETILIKEEIDYFDDNYIDKSSNENVIKRFFSPIKEGSLRGSIFSFASINFDTTSLSFPLAISYMGLIPGSLVLFIMSFLSHWSLKLLLMAGRKRRIYNYRELIRNCIGDKMVLIADINNIILNIGAITAYIVTISRFFLETINSSFGVEETKILKSSQMLCSMILLQIPLSLIKNISKLQYLSILGSFVLIYTLIMMTIESFFYYPIGIEDGRSIELFRNANWNYLDTFSIFLYGFCPHNGMFLIYSEMKNPTLRRTTKVLDRTSRLQIFIFTIIAYSGFFSLIKNVPQIFISRPPLNNFDPYDYLNIIAKVLFIISLHGQCAINFNLLRGTISGLFFKGKETNFIQNLIVICTIYIVSNLMAYYSDSVVSIIGIISGISVTFICFVFPILCYVYSNDYTKTHFKNIISFIIMIIICILGIMSTIKGLIEYNSNVNN